MGYHSISLNHLQFPLSMFYSYQHIDFSPPSLGLFLGTFFIFKGIFKWDFFLVKNCFLLVKLVFFTSCGEFLKNVLAFHSLNVVFFISFSFAAKTAIHCHSVHSLQCGSCCEL